ncbi:MAG: hypothetical protein AAGJ35_06525 [Myxococcota bacterium]
MPTWPVNLNISLRLLAVVGSPVCAFLLQSFTPQMDKLRKQYPQWFYAPPKSSHQKTTAPKPRTKAKIVAPQKSSGPLPSKLSQNLWRQKQVLPKSAKTAPKNSSRLTPQSAQAPKTQRKKKK